MKMGITMFENLQGKTDTRSRTSPRVAAPLDGATNSCNKSFHRRVAGRGVCDPRNLSGCFVLSSPFLIYSDQIHVFLLGSVKKTKKTRYD